MDTWILVFAITILAFKLSVLAVYWRDR